MKNKFNFLAVIFMALFLTQCVVQKGENSKAKIVDEKDLIVLENDSLEYKVVIFEPGFNAWLSGTARPRNYYSQAFLEQRNKIWVQEYNLRVLQPMLYKPDLYPFAIEYRSDIDYGYEVNYLLYHYFIFFQNQYNQKLGTFIPRI
jgi:hypothetical protein